MHTKAVVRCRKKTSEAAHLKPCQQDSIGGWKLCNLTSIIPSMSRSGIEYIGVKQFLGTIWHLREAMKEQLVKEPRRQPVSASRYQRLSPETFIDFCQVK